MVRSNMKKSKKKNLKMPSDREAVLLQLLVTGEKYGLELREAYERTEKKSLPLGSLYTQLDRMEDAGYVTSELRDPSAERGGHRRRYYKLEGEGARALDEYRTHLKSRVRIFLPGLRSRAVER